MCWVDLLWVFLLEMFMDYCKAVDTDPSRRIKAPWTSAGLREQLLLARGAQTAGLSLSLTSPRLPLSLFLWEERKTQTAADLPFRTPLFYGNWIHLHPFECEDKIGGNKTKQRACCFLAFHELWSGNLTQREERERERSVECFLCTLWREKGDKHERICRAARIRRAVEDKYSWRLCMFFFLRRPLCVVTPWEQLFLIMAMSVVLSCSFLSWGSEGAWEGAISPSFTASRPPVYAEAAREQQQQQTRHPEWAQRGKVWVYDSQMRSVIGGMTRGIRNGRGRISLTWSPYSGVPYSGGPMAA